jgi:hypothetical protein
MKHKTRARLILDVEFDRSCTDAESVARAFEILIETGMSTPGILEEYGDVKFNGVTVIGCIEE